MDLSIIPGIVIFILIIIEQFLCRLSVTYPYRFGLPIKQIKGKRDVGNISHKDCKRLGLYVYNLSNPQYAYLRLADTWGKKSAVLFICQLRADETHPACTIKVCSVLLLGIMYGVLHSGIGVIHGQDLSSLGIFISMLIILAWYYNKLVRKLNRALN